MKKLIGNREFYKKVLTIAIPIIIQNGITNFVSLLDNIMVGRVGTEQMSGVAIVNQLLFVFSLALFGAVSGPGIFTAQFVGQKNDEGVRYTMRLKLIMVTVIAIVSIGLFCVFDDQLISLFLHETDEGLDLMLTLEHAKKYLEIMLVGLVPFALCQAYAGTLREAGETIVPMRAGLTAVLVNLVLNWVLIFGYLGAPKMGVEGAAVATVVSRFVELGIIVVWTHAHKEKNAFAVGLYKGMGIPGDLAFKMIKTGLPLFFNEFLWALGMSLLTQSYSTRGLDVIAAFNISNTIVNLFNVVFISMGNVVAIIIGQILGSGDTEEVVDTDRKLIAFSVFLSAVFAIILAIMAPLFPKLYNTSDSIRALSVNLMRVAAVTTPLGAYLHATYFTLRSGGKTFITFLFDSVFLWLVSCPLAYILSRFTGMPIIPLYISVMCIDIIKAILGTVLLHKRVWIQDLVN